MKAIGKGAGLQANLSTGRKLAQFTGTWSGLSTHLIRYVNPECSKMSLGSQGFELLEGKLNIPGSRSDKRKQ